MAYAHLGHDVEVGNNCVVANSVQLAGEVILEDWVVIGGMSAVHQFCRIGAHAMVSGMCGVLSDVAPYTKVFGLPAAYMGINLVYLDPSPEMGQIINFIKGSKRGIIKNAVGQTTTVAP
jgi:UDP-N-acetylglucosamine acyltransferase